MKFRFYAVKLSLIMIAAFLAQVFISGFTEFFLLNRLSWIQPWRFLTSIFLHGGIVHLLLNLFALVFFGSILEKQISGRRFLIVFFTSGIIANLISVNFYNSSLGASGAIFGVLGALIILSPLMIVFAFGIPMPLFIAGLLWAAADILGTYGFFAGNPIDNTGSIAHLSGMFFGLLFGILYRKLLVRKRRINVSIDENQVRKWEKTWMRS